jgi:hypothetical protein
MDTIIEEQIGPLSNWWWACVANDYSITILLIVGFIIACLKTWAIMHPGVKNDSIVCLWSGWLYGFPGIKKEDKPAEIKEP